MNMSEKLPHQFNSLEEVTSYWRHCLSELENGVDETLVASHMVGVVSSEKDEEWSKSHPAYSIVFELAASLEVPSGSAATRVEQWDCIRVLLPVLEDKLAH